MVQTRPAAGGATPVMRYHVVISIASKGIGGSSSDDAKVDDAKVGKDASSSVMVEIGSKRKREDREGSDHNDVERVKKDSRTLSSLFRAAPIETQQELAAEFMNRSKKLS